MRARRFYLKRSVVRGNSCVFLLAELGSETDEQDFVRMHDEFNKLLLQEAGAGKRLIIVVDEAQNLDSSVLEMIRLLSDFETPRAKLLQIILAGQPELADKLASGNFRSSGSGYHCSTDSRRSRPSRAVLTLIIDFASPVIQAVRCLIMERQI